MLLEVDLAGENAKEDPITAGVRTATTRKSMSKAKLQILKNIEAAVAFLKQFITAMILICINTHSLEENGLLVYMDKDLGNMEACSLETVGIILV